MSTPAKKRSTRGASPTARRAGIPVPSSDLVGVTDAAVQDEPGAVAVSSVPFGEVEDSGLRIVGIGASAGGLEALERFLSSVPAGSRLALVIVQHLDPTHEGMLAELLQRSTSMRVAQVKDRT